MGTQIKIELANRLLYLVNGGNTIGSYPVAIGKPATPTPQGEFKVLNKIMHPGGALGTRWIQFTTREHGIHGTNQPWLIGQAVSNGCVRMYNSDVEIVYARINIGTPVIIRNYFQSGHRQPENKNYMYYTVKNGDSLWAISRRFNISLELLKNFNDLRSNLIYPGQKLKIPY